MSKERSGALFELGDCTIEDLPTLFRGLELYPKQCELLQGIFDLCAADEQGSTDMPSLCEHLNIARPTVLQRLGRLVELGMVSSEMRQVHEGLRRSNVYQVQRPIAVSQGTALPVPVAADDSETPPAVRGQSEFEFANKELVGHRELHYHPDVHRRMKWKADRLVVFSFLAGLRLGTASPSRKVTRIYMGERYFNLEVRAPSGSLIAGVTDLRVLIVVFSLIRESLIHAKGIVGAEEGYLIKMEEICQAMGMDPLPGNKRSLYEQLHRWRSSEFIISDDRGALRFADDAIEENKSFNVISELHVLKHVSPAGKTPELIHLALAPGIMKELRDRSRTLSIHQQILRDRKPSPLYHLFYYWCRRVVQHAQEPKFFTVSHLQRELLPHMTVIRARSELLVLVSEHRMGGDPHYAKFPGYLARFHQERDGVSIMADPADPLVGENSPYQLAAEEAGTSD